LSVSLFSACEFSWFICIHILCRFIGEGSEVFYRNGGKQPDERTQDRSSIFLMIGENNLLHYL